MLKPANIALIVLLGAVLAVPILLGASRSEGGSDARRLVIITPHMEHLRFEFAEAFTRWHTTTYGEPVFVDYRQPGGTSEIRKQLQAQYNAAIKRGDIAADGSCAVGAMPYDLLFGGGSYEHDQMKRGVTADLDGDSITVPISTPTPFTQDALDEWFGENRIGAQPLYDDERYWFGVAMSSFGIVFNRDVIERLGIGQAPATWSDLTEYRYAGWLALSDPRQSGSVATAYESILNNHGWDEGWRILRSMAANAQYFSNWSTKAPVDVSRGEAAAGVAIDFYGRYQSQAARRPGESAGESRVGFVEPEGIVFVDPDPVSMLRGGPDPELAQRFIEFLLTEEGQAIWQFPIRKSESEMGPVQFELRRLPARRVMYEKHFDRFVDRVDSYSMASEATPLGWRSMIAPIFASSAMDVHHLMREAWDALHEIQESGDTALFEEADALFFAMPEHEFVDGRVLTLTPETYSEIRNDWRDADRAAELKIQYTAFFRDKYRDVIRMANRLALHAEDGAQFAAKQH